jgi:hypothetical protein
MHYYTLHIFSLYKSNIKTILMFYRKFADEGENPVNNPNIYNVEGDHRLLANLQPYDKRKCVENLFISVRFRNYIF